MNLSFPAQSAAGSSESTLICSDRVVLASKTEHHCRTEDVSPGGMKLMCMAKPQIGESVVAYIDALGRFFGSRRARIPRGLLHDH